MSTFTDTANILAEQIAAHKEKFGTPEIIAAPAPTEDARDTIEAGLRSEIARLKSVNTALTLGAAPSDNRKPTITAQRVRAEIGLNNLRGMTRENKFQALGQDPASFSDERLEDLFALGNDGVAAAELMRAAPLQYKLAKEAATLLNIAFAPRKQKR